MLCQCEGFHAPVSFVDRAACRNDASINSPEVQPTFLCVRLPCVDAGQPPPCEGHCSRPELLRPTPYRQRREPTPFSPTLVATGSERRSVRRMNKVYFHSLQKACLKGGFGGRRVSSEVKFLSRVSRS